MTQQIPTARSGSVVGRPGGDRLPNASSPDAAGRPTLPGPNADPNSAWAPASAATPMRIEDARGAAEAHPFSDLPGAAVAGCAVAAWMALPDVLHGRGARAVLKLGILGGVTAWAVVQDRARKAKLPKGLVQFGADRPRPHAPDPESRGATIARRAVYGGAAFATLVVVDSIGHQSAKYLGARGIPAPHTLLGLAAGAATAIGVTSSR
ncbi:hypothetical protein ACPYO6_16005 [Georgenia sp. Z1344]|uniref:hypothetical protein n=1 Tax=Georgenia sp. Z1344 TaxID=3416706 RepID=UPI003CE7004B